MLSDAINEIEFWKPQKDQLFTTQTEERNYTPRNYYTTDRQSSDQPKLYKHPDKTVCGYALFTVQNTVIQRRKQT